jgi:hypothetical protein
MLNIDKYSFSFTASSLRLKDMIIVAQHQVNNTEIDYVDILGNGKSVTGKRMLSEYNKRLAVLTDKQLSLLADSDLVVQKQIAFLSVCKTYAFIRDFVIEVLREKALIFDYDITDGDYISFFRRKNELHTEMDNLTDKTQYKLKQVTFKILEESGIIDSVKQRQIQPQILDTQTISVIISDNKEWLKVFLMSDIDIENISN